MSDDFDDFNFAVPLSPPSKKCLIPPPSIVTSMSPPPSIVTSISPPPSIVTPISPPPSIVTPMSPPPSIITSISPPPSIVTSMSPPPSIVTSMLPPPSTITSMSPPPSIVTSMPPPPSTITSMSQFSVTQSTSTPVTITSTGQPLCNTQGPIPLYLPIRDSGEQHRHSPLNDFDYKRLRKSGLRKTVNSNASMARMLQSRIWQRDHRDRPFLQPDVLYTPQLLPPQCYKDNSTSSIATSLVKTVCNKVRCHVFCLVWTPEGRRLITGLSSGEFTLWNGITFNFETILQAHDCAIRSMVWSHNRSWMVTGDHAGFIKYWQSNMNNTNMFKAHTEAVRGISFSHSDDKFATCSDDGTIRVWDFFTNSEEKILRGHGAEVKCIDWHPYKGLLISGSKDNQQPIKLWDPKTGQSLVTLHAHKSTVMDIKWNANGNWVVTASRDHLVKLFDIRNLSHSVQTFRGHKKEASAVTWHPYHESLLCSGDSDGSILYWNVGVDEMVGSINQAHESIIWSLAWNPLGEVLCSGSNDYSCKFWTRNRPGDKISGRYTTENIVSSIVKRELTTTETKSIDIPGLGLEDFSEDNNNTSSADSDTIPLKLNLDSTKPPTKVKFIKKVPYTKPIDKDFQRNWIEHRNGRLGDESHNRKFNYAVQSVLSFIPGTKPSRELEPTFLIAYGQIIKVNQNSELEYAIKGGQESLIHFLRSGAVPEVRQHISFDSNDDPIYKYAEHYLRNDHDLRMIRPTNNLPTNKDVDFRINNIFNFSHGLSSGLQTSPDGIFNRKPSDQLFNRQPPDQLINRQPPDQLFNRQPPDQLFNRQPPDQLFNRQSPDQLFNRQSPDQLFNRQPPDQLFNRQSPDQLFNRQPPDQLFNRQSPDQIFNRQSPDLLFNRQSPDQIFNRQSPDLLFNRQSPDQIFNRQSPDLFFNRQSPDQLFNRQPPDQLFNRQPPDQFLNTVALSQPNLTTVTRYNSYRNNFPNYSYRPFKKRNQMNRRYGPSSTFRGSNFIRPFNPQGPFTNYNNM